MAGTRSAADSGRHDAASGSTVEHLVVGRGFVLPDLTGAIPGSSLTLTSPDWRQATYYDSTDLRLTRSGVTLCWRGTTRGGTWVVGFPPRERSGRPLGAREIELAGTARRPPADALGLVRAYARTAPLVRVARLATRTVRMTVRDATGRSVVRISDEDVHLDDVRGGEGFRELVVEVGDDLGAKVSARVARELRQAGAEPAVDLPKVARALGSRALVPRDGAHPSSLERTSDLVRWSVAEAYLRLVSHDPGVRLGLDSEEVHQARVATRRLRADLRSFRRVLDRDWAASLSVELKWLAAALGSVRDADVMEESLTSYAAVLTPADRSLAERLFEDLRGQRTVATEALAAAMDSRRYCELLDRLVAAAADPVLAAGGDGDAASWAPAIVRPAWKRLRRMARSLPPDPSDDELHQLRIQAKRTRYAAEAVAEVTGARARTLARKVATLQEVLGDLHDGVVAEAFLRAWAGAPGPGGHEVVGDESPGSPAANGHDRPAEPGEALVIGQLIGLVRRNAAAARGEWPRVWRRLERTRPRWLRSAPVSEGPGPRSGDEDRAEAAGGELAGVRLVGGLRT